MQVEPDDDEASGMLLAELEAMKPAEQESETGGNGAVEVNVPLDAEVATDRNGAVEPDLYTDEEYDPSFEERTEREGLTTLLAEAAMMEECEVFHVRCQVRHI